MNKKKLKNVVKEHNKVAKQELTSQLITALKTVTTNFEGSKKIEKLIIKKAKQLAKQIVAHQKFTPVTAVETPVLLIPEVTAPTKKKAVKKEETPA